MSMGFQCATGCFGTDPSRWCDAFHQSERGRPLFALPRGTRVGDLVVGRLLGRGGFGLTYLALDEQLAAQRVIKEFFPEGLVLRDPGDRRSVQAISVSLAADYERLLARFVDEARTLARLAHPHVVPILQFARHAGTAYFTMPYLLGETVQGRHDARIARIRPAVESDAPGPTRVWTCAELVDVFDPVLDALSFLHAQSPPVLHRDIKPDNLYLAREPGRSGERVLLLDFGAAREDLGLSKVSRVYTPGFAPPEQIAGVRQSVETDVYAVAATLYYLLTNIRPPVAPVAPTALASLVSDVPSALCEVVQAGLAVRAGDRPSLEAVQAALQTAAQEEGRKTTARVRRSAKRRARWVAMGVGAVVLAGGVYLLRSCELSPVPPPAPVDSISTDDSSTARRDTTETDRSQSSGDTTGKAQEIQPPMDAQRLGIGFGDEQFAVIPSGRFLMGNDAGDADEQPVRTVEITQAFLMQRTEVTQQQWKAIMGSNPSYFAACGEVCPVESISWDEVEKFLKELNAVDPGKNYRLPTEAEWEYAASAGRRSPIGGTGIAGDMAWFADNSGARTRPVARKKPNAWGLFDMHGNVDEWVQDWYGEGYYAQRQNTDPSGPPLGVERVIRGGSWFDDQRELGLSTRFSTPPETTIDRLGFRLVRER